MVSLGIWIISCSDAPIYAGLVFTDHPGLMSEFDHHNVQIDSQLARITLTFHATDRDSGTDLKMCSRTHEVCAMHDMTCMILFHHMGGKNMWHRLISYVYIIPVDPIHLSALGGLR
jgi:hypothetical protein